MGGYAASSSSSLFSQVFRWRTAAATAWLLVLAVPAVLVFQLLAACSPLHPLQGLAGGWDSGEPGSFLGP